MVCEINLITQALLARNFCKSKILKSNNLQQQTQPEPPLSHTIDRLKTVVKLNQRLRLIAIKIDTLSFTKIRRATTFHSSRTPSLSQSTQINVQLAHPRNPSDSKLSLQRGILYTNNKFQPNHRHHKRELRAQTGLTRKSPIVSKMVVLNKHKIMRKGLGRIQSFLLIRLQIGQVVQVLAKNLSERPRI